MCILVLILEMVNTAIEAIVDMTVGKQFHECAQKAKDVAAGAVVVAAIAALVNGVVIFLPAALRLIESWP
jgi:diacylglycerol kinase (ATP)